MLNLKLNKPKDKARVVVAMSGGVDSSCVAAMVKEAGYETIGITLQLYDHGAALAKKGACCAGQDIEDARRVCESLNIPHYVLNYESLFKESVMEDFADSYIRGETPIPCVKCNQTVKFRDLLKVAKDLDADALVTGHYVRRVDNENNRTELHNAIDSNKDQTYFLFATTQEQLDYLHFPLGEYTKDQTRELAQKYDLIVADKPDSQDICFVPNGNYAKVVEKLRPNALDAGKIVHIETGEEFGDHEGIINYTVGQRKGLDIGGLKDPLYVIKISAEEKIVYVGEEKYLFKDSLNINLINWLEDEIPHEGKEVKVRMRNAQKQVSAKIFPPAQDGVSKVELYEPQKAISPGQACVIYDGTRVLGGGWILRK